MRKKPLGNRTPSTSAQQSSNVSPEIANEMAAAVLNCPLSPSEAPRG